MENPIQLFKNWYTTELSESQARLPAACCLSTIGLDGFPNARFISLKDIKNEQFIITGSMQSRKGLEISANPKVGLSFWWEATQRQIRVQGEAHFLAKQIAQSYFVKRSRASQLVSFLFQQGEEIASLETLRADYEQHSASERIPVPLSWGGIGIAPLRIEFMEFETSRLHKRILFKRNGKAWEKVFLQP